MTTGCTARTVEVILGSYIALFVFSEYILYEPVYNSIFYMSGHWWHDLYKLHLTIFPFYEIFYGVSSNFFLICQINFQTYWDYFFHFILFFLERHFDERPYWEIILKKSVSNWVILQSRTLSTVPLFNQRMPIFSKSRGFFPRFSFI